MEIRLSLHLPCALLIRMRSLLFIFGVSLSLMLTSCSTPAYERLDPPTEKVDGLVVSETTGVLSLSFLNTNIVPLVVSSSSHKLLLGDSSMGTIDDSQAIGLPGSGRIVHTVKLPPQIAKAAQAYLHAHPGQVRVTVKTALEIATTVDETLTLKCSGTGIIQAP